MYIVIFWINNAPKTSDLVGTGPLKENILRIKTFYKEEYWWETLWKINMLMQDWPGRSPYFDYLLLQLVLLYGPSHHLQRLFLNFILSFSQKNVFFGNHPTTLAGSFNLWFSQNNTKTVVLRIMCPPPRGKDYNYWFFLGIPGVHWVERHLDVLFLKLANYHHIIFKILLLFLFYRCSSLSWCWQALMLLLLACVKSKSHPSCFIWNLKCPLILENIERTDVRGDT